MSSQERVQRALEDFQEYHSAVVAILFWDWLCSLHDELNLIWRAKWSWTKVAYLCARYFTLVVEAVFLGLYHVEWTPAACDPAYRLGPVFSALCFASVELILLCRTYALYEPNRPVLALLITLLLGLFACHITFSIIGVAPMPALRGGQPCVPTAANNSFLLGYFVVPLVYDAVVTGLLIWKAVSMQQHQQRYFKRSTLPAILIRHGLLYFIGIGGIHLLNVAFYAAPIDPSYKSINSNAAVVFSSIFGCRLVLALKRRAQTGELHYQSGVSASHRSPFRDAHLSTDESSASRSPEIEGPNTPVSPRSLKPASRADWLNNPQAARSPRAMSSQAIDASAQV